MITSERDNYRERLREVEDRLVDKEATLDKVRKDYNELMEKYLAIPKKVTTTSTTIKTVVDQDKEDLPPEALEAANREVRGTRHQYVQVGDAKEIGAPRKEDLA